MTPAERDNITLFSPGRRGFYEVYYLKVNDPGAGFAAWLRYTILSPARPGARPVAELWAIAFDGNDSSRHVAAKSTHPIDALHASLDRFEVRIGDAILRHHGASGSIAGPQGDIRWDLRFQGAETGFRHFPVDAMYSWPIPKTKVVSPNVDLRIDGEMTVGGRTVTLQGAPGMQAHLWGSQHAASWVWAHCNAWSGCEPVWFEGLTARVRVGPVSVPPLTILALHRNGTTHLWNRISDLRRNRSEPREPAWSFACERGELRLEGSIEAPFDRFVGVRYEDPDGSERFCRNTKIAKASLRILRRPHPTEPFALESELASDAAALEFVSERESPQVPTRI